MGLVEQWIDYNPLPYQAQFHGSSKPKVYLSAGYGAGKTYCLCMHLFQLMSENRKFPGGILAPSLKMFKRDVLPTIREICSENGIAHKYHKTDYVFEFPHTDSTIYIFHSEDDGDSIKGPNLAFFLINEVTLCSKAAFDAALSRVRIKEAPKLQVAMSGTPEGFNWAYEYFVEKPREDTELIFGNTRLNTHVADTYVNNLLSSYDSKMVEQYVDGKFVNLSGNRAAWAFDRHKHCDESLELDLSQNIFVSVDFNVDPMSAVIWNSDGFGLTALDEVHIPNGNTPKLVDALKNKLGSLVHRTTVYPDPAGTARTTATRDSSSDIAILKNAGFEAVKHKTRIESVMNCLNATNAMLEKSRIKINHKKCPNLVADLEQCIIKQGTTEIDKSNPKRSHWLDGMKNMIDYEFPIRRPDNSREYRIR